MYILQCKCSKNKNGQITMNPLPLSVSLPPPLSQPTKLTILCCSSHTEHIATLLLFLFTGISQLVGLVNIILLSFVKEIIIKCFVDW